MVVNVSIVKVKMYQDTEGGGSERSSAFQMGRLGPATRYELSICVSACSEHKKSYRLQGGIDRLLCHMKMLLSIVVFLNLCETAAR